MNRYVRIDISLGGSGSVAELQTCFHSLPIVPCTLAPFDVGDCREH